MFMFVTMFVCGYSNKLFCPVVLFLFSYHNHVSFPQMIPDIIDFAVKQILQCLLDCSYPWLRDLLPELVQIISEPPKRGWKTGATRKLSKSAENTFDLFDDF